MSKLEDLTGKMFGHLEVISFVEFRGNPLRPYWKCLCDCGRTIEAKSGNLKRQTSCHYCAASRRKTSHGKRKTREFNIWGRMIQRCHNPKSSDYAYYGGRGIQVAQKWRDSFLAFLDDMGNCPPKYTIDRIDNSGNYEPGNCQWISHRDNCMNKRNNHIFTAYGKSMTLSQWSDHTGVNYATILTRIKRGWSVEDALTKPASESHRLRFLKNN